MRVGYSCVGYAKKSVTKPQEERTVKKMYALVDHVCLAFAGIVPSIIAPQYVPLQVCGT